MIEQFIPRNYYGIQYLGNNGAGVFGQVPADIIVNSAASIVSEVDGVLTVEITDLGTHNIEYSAGDWLVWPSGGGLGSLTDVDMSARYIKVSDI
jgi:hypothetical protein